MTTRQLTVFLDGEFPGSTLNDFRDRLGLSRRGRLDDDWDQLFGHRELRPRGDNWSSLDLYRGFDPSQWTVTITYETEPLPGDEVEDLRRQILAAAAEAGMVVRAQVPPAPEELQAARERLAAWMTEQSPLTGRTFTADDLTGYTVSTHEEWLVFTPPGRANRVYLVSEDTVYSFAPARETLEAAVANARGSRAE